MRMGEFPSTNQDNIAIQLIKASLRKRGEEDNGVFSFAALLEDWILTVV